MTSSVSGQAPVIGEEQAVSLSIVQVVGSLDKRDTGPAYSIPRLCRALSNYGHAVTLLSTTKGDFAHQDLTEGYRECRYPISRSLPLLGKLGVSSALSAGLLSAAARAEVLHTHGLWRFANIYPAIAAQRFGKPLVLSPRGMLAPRALLFSPWSKRLFWMLRQRDAANAVACFHATSKQEYDDIRAYGLTQPVALIPNGIDLPEELAPKQRSAGESRTVLFLGRLHPIKAIDRLIKAWHLLGTAQSSWRLIIVGSAELAYDLELAALVRDLGLTNVEFRGAARDTEKWGLLQSSDLMVLPSLSENFGVVVAESLAAGTPVIASRGTPWQALEANACGWWVDNAPESLAAALGSALRLSAEERDAMGQRGRKWMERDFCWTGVARQMTDVYRWLNGEGATPACVITV